MENAFILEQENQMAISTEKVKGLRSKRRKSLVAIKPLFLYFPFLGTCLALAYGEIYLWSILLFICGNCAFLWGYIINQTSEIEISLDTMPSIDQEQLEGQLYERSIRNT
ncbi:MAG: hypothetical protein WBM98_09855 [Maribacter sp.]|uniref:hypothetical protein n=1 Tax=Maribacter sp. TaxID=1897614 RepID=UPI003C77F737